MNRLFHLNNLHAHPILPVGANTVLAAGVNMTLELLAAHQKQLEAVNNNAYTAATDDYILVSLIYYVIMT